MTQLRLRAHVITALLAAEGAKTKEDMADLLGVSRPTVIRQFNGECEPGTPMFAAVVRKWGDQPMNRFFEFVEVAAAEDGEAA